MKTTLSLLAFCLISACLVGQVAINNNGTPPDPNAILDVSSSSMGILIPRLTTVQRLAIPDLPDGLLLYDTNTQSFWYSHNSAWIEISGSASSSWVLTGNAGTNPATDFIGTSDNQPLKFRTNNIPSGILSPQGATFFGYQAGISNEDNTNTGFGASALGGNTWGWNNTAFGRQALGTNSTGCYNTAVGYAALSNNNGSFNTALGRYALSANSGGSSNTAAGHGALAGNTGGSNNNAFGDQAINLNTIGSNNVAAGTGSLFNNLEGSNNTALGHRALYDNAYGSYNTFVGSFSNVTSDNHSYSTGVGNGVLIAGSYNTAIGNSSFAEGVNSTALGNGAQALGDNTVRLGNDDITSLYCMGPYRDSTATMAPNLAVDSNGRIMRSTLTSSPGTGDSSKIAFWANDSQLGYDTSLHWNSSLHNMGIGTASPDSSAILDLTSTNKGFLPPRMTKAQRKLLANPETGMLVYQTDSLPGYYYYSGENWTEMVGSEYDYVGKVMDVEGNTYHTVRIGEQIWMAENLRTSHYKNGHNISCPMFILDPQGNISYDSKWDVTAAYFEYDCDACRTLISGTNQEDTLYLPCKEFFYSYAAIVHPWGICPEGWHIPSETEWEIMLASLNGNGMEGYLLRTPQYWRENEGAFNTNPFGFSALPTRITGNGQSVCFSPDQQWTKFATSTEFDEQNSIQIRLDFHSTIVVPLPAFKNNSLSIRCIKD